MEMICPIAQAHGDNADQVFILTPDLSLTFARFDDYVQDCCGQIRAMGFAPGSRVMVKADRSWQTLALLFALFRSGHVAVPVDPDSPQARLQDLQRQIAAVAVLDQDFMAPISSSVSATDVGVDVLHPCLGIFTSGSTGVPKLVMHSLATLLANARSANAIIPLAGSARTLLSLPLYHIGGIAQVLRAALSATALVIGSRVEASEQLNEWRVTHASMVSTQLQRLLAQQLSTPFLQAVLLGGGPCPETLLQMAKARNLPIWQTYGMSETASQLVMIDPQGQMQVSAGNEFHISADQELWIRGDSLFLGYWSEQGIDSARDDQGWFHSGDLAVLSEGRLEIIGRKDNQFVSGGKNVQPEEIERQLQRLNDVRRAVVVPVAHVEFGQIPFAFVELQPFLQCTPAWQQQTIDLLKTRLPGYLVPRRFTLLPAETGLKPRRPILQQMAQALMSSL